MNENYINSKIKQLQGITLLDTDNKRCKLKDYSIYKGEKSVLIRFSYGFGASETIESYTVPFHDLDIKLDLYKQAPKIETPELDKKSEDNPIIKKPLEMSQHTEDNLKGLRKHLFNAIRKLEGGTMKEGEAKAMASIAQVIINSAKLEMEFKLLTSDKPKIDLIGGNEL
jgi:hypothetical protein